MPLSGAGPVCVVSAAPPTAVSGGLAERLDLARRALERDLAGQRDQRREVRQGNVPRRSSERIRAYPRSAAGEPARTPTKLLSLPLPDSAPLRIGALSGGAVSSSWMSNLEILGGITLLSARN